MDYKTLVTDALVQIDRLERELTRSKQRVQQLEKSEPEPIAVVGIGCRYPGRIDSPHSFWQALIEGKDCIGDVGKRWNLDKYYDPDPFVPGKICSRYLGMIDDVMMFDAGFFGISPREAKAMDPQQRVLLEVMWHALSDAGMSKDSIAGSKTGVYVGIGAQDYSTVQAALGGLGEVTAYDGTGNALSIAAARISYWLDLSGPSMAVDTACSSSLVAVHLAMQSLRAGETEAAIVGGVNVITNPATSVVFSKAQMLAPDGRCKTFDQSADGYVRSEGCGVLILKPLTAALESKDRIYGLLRGSAVNQDGKSQGLTAPNENAQVAVLKSALENARISADQVDYVEAHGTGTPLGDPIELSALADVFKRDSQNPLAVGSVKTNLGHCETAAGVTGIIKGLLSLQQGVIPKHINYSQPNTYVPWDSNGIEVVDVEKRIDCNGVIGVSSFGFGGTNAHVVLQGAGDLASVSESEPLTSKRLFPISAQDRNALESRIAQIKKQLQSEAKISLSDLAYTLQSRSSHLPIRQCVLADSQNELVEQLDNISQGPENKPARKPNMRANKTAFLFPGQGAQYVGMGKVLYANYPVFQRVVDACEDWLKREKNYSVKSVLWAEQAEARKIDQTEHTQIALFVVEIALAKLWMSLGVQPQRLIGHSIGEYSAAYIAGMLSLEDALTLVFARGELMSSLAPVGAMLAVSAAEKNSQEILEKFSDIDLAAQNAPSRWVFAASVESIERLEQYCQSHDLSHKRLAVSRAFHSTHMSSAAQEFSKLLAAVTFHKARFPIISTLTGELASDQMCQPDYWTRQLQQPVNFNKAAQQLLNWRPKVIIEVGPGSSLLALVQEISAATERDSEESLNLASLRRGFDETVVLGKSLAELYVAGTSIEWNRLAANADRQLISLPNYPFARELYWFETPELNEDVEHAIARHEEDHKARTELEESSAAQLSSPTDAQGSYCHPLFTRKTSHPLLTQTIFDVHLSPLDFPELKQHKVMGNMVVAGGFILSLFEQALVDVVGEKSPLHFTSLQLIQPIHIAAGEYPTVQILIESEKASKSSKTWQLSLLEMGDDSLTEYARAEAEVLDGESPVDPELQQIGDALSSSSDGVITSAEFYQRLMENTELVHGPDYQWLHRVRRNNEGIEADLKKPVGSVPLLQSFWHAGLLDSCLQGIAALGLDQLKEPNAPVPVGFDDVCIYGYPSYQEDSSFRLFSRLLNYSDQGIEIALQLFQTSAAASQQSGESSHRLLLDIKRVEFRYLSKALFEELVLGNALPLHYKLAWLPRAELLADEEANNPVGPSLLKLTLSPQAELDRQALNQLNNIDAGATLLLDATALQLDNNVDWNVDWNVSAAWRLTEALQQVLAFNPAQITLLLADNLLSDWAMGVVKSLRLERYDVLFQTINLDLNSLQDSENTQLMQAKVIAAGGSGDFKISAQRLFQQQLQPAVDISTTSGGACITFENGIIVTGGLGGIGWHFVETLVDNGCDNILILHRSPASTSQQQQIEQWNENGFSIKTKCVDIANLNALQKAFADDESGYTSLLHCAGSLSDGLIATLDRSDLDRVVAGKINGLMNLLSVFPPGQLTNIVLFSSQAAQLGNVGQSLYGGANAVLDGIAQRWGQQHPDLNIHSIGWSPWNHLGMTAELDDSWYENLTTAGVRPIEKNRALTLLQQAVSQASGASAVLDLDWAAYLNTLPAQQSDQFFYQWLLDQVDLQHTDSSRVNSQLLETLVGLSSQHRLDHILGYMNEQLTQVLNRDHVDLDESVLNLGVDSLMAMDFRSTLKRELALDVPLPLILEGASLRGLSEWVNSQLTEDYFQRIQQGGIDKSAAEMSMEIINTADLLELDDVELDLDEETITIAGQDVAVNISRDEGDSEAVLEFEL